MDPRPATLADAEDIARLHLQAWAETYPGLLPEAEIARHTLASRLAQWQSILSKGASRVIIAPGVGFASAGVQRNEPLQAMGFRWELYALYLLRAAQGQGLGAALLRAVTGPEPFSALVIEGNDQACGFYERMGGRVLEVRPEKIGEVDIRERVYVWDAGI